MYTFWYTPQKCFWRSQASGKSTRHKNARICASRVRPPLPVIHKWQAGLPFHTVNVKEDTLVRIVYSKCSHSHPTSGLKYLWIHKKNTGTIWCNSDKSTQRAQTSLAEADHYPHIARIPDLENQQISIWKSDTETCAQTYLVCWTLFLN